MTTKGEVYGLEDVRTPQRSTLQEGVSYDSSIKRRYLTLYRDLPYLEELAAASAEETITCILNLYRKITKQFDSNLDTAIYFVNRTRREFGDKMEKIADALEGE